MKKKKKSDNEYMEIYYLFWSQENLYNAKYYSRIWQSILLSYVIVISKLTYLTK